ncbi:tRNA3(Ser)-specific nuclease WapA precursor [bacterium BMS3Bbin08]|nr:tRNA3(Ser)-specific nuclease WapA precursor [bacterium BMS3Bbin08]
MNFIYNVENRLINVKDDTGSIIAEYYYDPFGRRIFKEVGGTRTYYLYSDEGLIGEYDSSGIEIKTYGYKPDTTWTTDTLFMKENGNYYFYHNDHLGTPMVMTDISGNLVWSAAYDSFGKADVQPSSTIENNLRFPGQYFDEETGFHYNWNRYYDPTTGRYITTDPLWFTGRDVNLYRYVGNSPINFINPWGLLTSVFEPGFDSESPLKGPGKPGILREDPDVGIAVQLGIFDISYSSENGVSVSLTTPGLGCRFRLPIISI